MLEVSNFWMGRRRLGLFWACSLLLCIGCNAGLSKAPSCKVALPGIADAAISGASLNDQELVLTFDRAPTKMTEEIAAYLSSRSIGGTFFLEGQQITSADTLRTLRESGHLLGNGTLSHASLTKTPALLTEIRKVDQMITPYIVGDIYLFRAPRGEFNKNTAEYLNRQGLQKYVGPIGWDVSLDASDPQVDRLCGDEGVSISDCASQAFAAVTEKKRGILRFDANQQDLPLFLRELIPNLEVAKFKFLRLDQVPDIRRELVKREARPSTVGDEGGCDDYGSPQS